MKNVVVKNSAFFDKCIKEIILHYLLRDEEMKDPAVVYAIRSYARSLRVDYRAWLKFTYKAYGDLKGIIVDESFHELYLETEELEVPQFEEWVRGILKPIPNPSRVYVRQEGWERFRVWGTIVRAHAKEKGVDLSIYMDEVKKRK